MTLGLSGFNSDAELPAIKDVLSSDFGSLQLIFSAFRAGCGSKTTLSRVLMKNEYRGLLNVTLQLQHVQLSHSFC